MLIITSLDAAKDAYAARKPARVISLLSEEEQPPVFDGLPADRHLMLYVESESCSASLSKAAKDRARQIIDFIRAADGDGDILIHCKRGVARSTAAAFVIMCMREPDADEAVLLRRLRKAAPHADPCPLIVDYADEILGRNGRMSDAIADLCPPVTVIAAPLVVIGTSQAARIAG